MRWAAKRTSPRRSGPRAPPIFWCSKPITAAPLRLCGSSSNAPAWAGDARQGSRINPGYPYNTATGSSEASSFLGLSRVEEPQSLRNYSIFRSGCIVASGLEVVGAFDGCEGIEQRANGGPEAFDRPLGGFAQECFELGEGILDRIEIGR